MNIERLKEFRDYFELQPDEQYCQVQWHHPSDSKYPCGTPSCIGGHLAAYLKKNYPRFVAEEVTHITGAGWHHNLARKFFGISRDQTTFLFLACPLQEGDDPTKAEAVAVLDILIETGKVDWKGARKRVALGDDAYKTWVKRNREVLSDLSVPKLGEKECQTP